MIIIKLNNIIINNHYHTGWQDGLTVAWDLWHVIIIEQYLVGMTSCCLRDALATCKHRQHRAIGTARSGFVAVGAHNRSVYSGATARRGAVPQRGVAQ